MVEAGAKPEEIGRGSWRPAPGQLRRDIVRSAGQIGERHPDRAGQSEIEQKGARAGIGDEDVSRLQIEVHPARLMDRRQRRDYLVDDRTQLAPGRHGLGGPFSPPFVQALPRCQRKHDVTATIGIDTEIAGANDPFRHDPPADSPFACGIGVTDELHRDRFTGRLVSGVKYRTAGAFSEGVPQAVTPADQTVGHATLPERSI